MVRRDDAGKPRFCPFRQTHSHGLPTFRGLAWQLQDDYGKKIFKSIEITLVSITILCQNVARLTFCLWVVVHRSVRSVFGLNIQNGVAHPNVRPNAILTLCLSLPSGAQLPSQIGLDAALAVVAKGIHHHHYTHFTILMPTPVLRSRLFVSFWPKTRPCCFVRALAFPPTAQRRPSRFARWRPCSQEKGRPSPLTDADRTRTPNTFSSRATLAAAARRPSPSPASFRINTASCTYAARLPLSQRPRGFPHVSKSRDHEP